MLRFELGEGASPRRVVSLEEAVSRAFKPRPRTPCDTGLADRRLGLIRGPKTTPPSSGRGRRPPA